MPQYSQTQMTKHLKMCFPIYDTNKKNFFFSLAVSLDDDIKERIQLQ